MKGRFATAEGELQALAERPRAQGPARLEAIDPSRPAATPLVFLSSDTFIQGFERADYLIDGILQRGVIYSNTGQTGAGKTAIALRIALSVGGGRDLGEREVAQGRVLFCARKIPTTSACG